MTVSTNPYRGARIVVTGGGRSGTSAAAVLQRCGASVQIVDRDPRVLTTSLAQQGITYAGDLAELPEGVDLVVTSPGWSPRQPLLVDAAGKGVPVVGEVEIAWMLRDPAVPWLAVTGTNGKTTTVGMLTAMLAAAGRTVAEVGNVGPPVIDAAVDRQTGYDVLSVELSSFQLHWAPSVRPASGALLNLAADHLDWHGSAAAYAADKARIFNAQGISVYNADDAGVCAEVAKLPTTARTVGFTLGVPDAGQLGVDGDELIDRTYAAAGGREVLASVGDVSPPGPHNVANALAAAALARTVGVSAADVREGLRRYLPGAHRNVLVASERRDGYVVDFVNDSKATNVHAAAASLVAYDHVVWIAGGLLKGASVDDVRPLIERALPFLRGVVLIGRDRGVIADALRRHAPEIPLVEVETTDDRAMRTAVDLAHELACDAGSRVNATVTVLLAPAAASMDMFADYAQRGDRFAEAARQVAEDS
ncbi:UDP-N-acetylmuramoylalanine--D-glutamate ligase [Antricoccus suffuscus]|uniref:UDP-N-acetylmuramoylalanine--D-glutamate ligase n=1 Tax=Antricoccus suffuscus TaxID=1629062 RepID=A0A2T0ZYI0_9ACTN|nr:UDP-N-acetylmuramoyl-L-alanine--D-glutamate ligase [Antricoccus suffuscus]PRZ41412.1 UDP-N-acetylmuramoylalanine--D-glutamate ligase [Antricoccus suffuscus]